MTQENKELLLKDLCARLLYGVIVETPKGKGHVCDINLTIFGYEFGVNVNATIRDNFSISYVKPYLFPLSSMTKEQEKELKYLCDWENDRWSGLVVIQESKFCMNTEIIDWLNKNHFDYSGLINKGLAIDATELNIY